MPLMKLSTYLLGCLTINQLTNGVVLQQETGSSGFLGTQRALDQGTEVFSEYGMMSGIVYPANQPYGPVLPDRTCPTIHGVKQYPVIHPTDTDVRVCMPFSPCPAAPAKGNVTLDGSLCLILCGKDTDCQPGAFCYFTGVAHVCAFNYTVG
ncbi:hypothetical protein FOZ62_032490 [Perkinsus olseni]|uniref:Uncharacterized protein n=2 Tax=Perkinsus olseni TaxID=32597 RepID=A0A7J6T694_PEROL|nr:hypothetical protein FOZ62_032490 [Perkinsus olseni]